MTPTIAAESLIFGSLLIVVALAELFRDLRIRRMTAAMHLQHYDNIVDKEMQK